MKKVLFIVNEYYPVGSAITNCLKPIIDEMKKSNIEVNILTRKYPLSLLNYEIIDNVKVYRVSDNYLNILTKRDNSKSLKHLFYKLYFHHIWKKYNRIYDGTYDIKKMIKKGEKLVKQVDTIISCSYPFTSHIIADKIRKDQKWFIYQFDPYTYNCTLPKNQIEQRLKIELEYLKKADGIFITEESYKENIKTELAIIKEKYIVLPYPLIKTPVNEVKSIKKDKITFTFTGALYTNLREPFKMLDILLDLNIASEINLYYFGDNEVITKLNNCKDRVNLYFKKSKNECDEALLDTNIILNIGNNTLNQTPSKVFELISLGKPILNFYELKQDTSKEILENYKLGYNIDVNNCNKEELINFINDYKYEILPFEEATKGYLKSEEVAQKFIEEVDKIGNR